MYVGSYGNDGPVTADSLCWGRFRQRGGLCHGWLKFVRLLDLLGFPMTGVFPGRQSRRDYRTSVGVAADENCMVPGPPVLTSWILEHAEPRAPVVWEPAGRRRLPDVRTTGSGPVLPS